MLCPDCGNELLFDGYRGDTDTEQWYCELCDQDFDVIDDWRMGESIDDAPAPEQKRLSPGAR